MKIHVGPDFIRPPCRVVVVVFIRHKYIHIFKNISYETKYQDGTFYGASAAPTPEVRTFNVLELMMGKNTEFIKIRHITATLNRQFQTHVMIP